MTRRAPWALAGRAGRGRRCAGDPWQIAAEQAALDALVVRRSQRRSRTRAPDAALVYRSDERADDRDPAARGGGGRARTIRSARGWSRVRCTSSRRTAGTRTTRRGGARRRGARREATLIGPLVVDGGDGRARRRSAVAVRTRGSKRRTRAAGRSRGDQAPVVARGRGCALDPSLDERGARRARRVVDVAVGSAQTIGVALRAHGAAVMHVGGHAGRRASVRARRRRGGPVRARRRAGGGARAPRGARGDGRRRGAARDRRVGRARQAARDARAATSATRRTSPWRRRARSPGLRRRPTPSGRRWRWGRSEPVSDRRPRRRRPRDAAAPDAPPELLLTYARAVEEADDLDEVHRAERARGAYERVLEAWPSAWEAIVAHAVLAGVRRGQTEARIWTLRDLDEHRTKRAKAGAVRERRGARCLRGRRRGARSAVRSREAPRWRARPRRCRGACSRARRRARSSSAPAAERVAFECATDARRRSRQARPATTPTRNTGDRKAAATELDRVRALYGSPSAYLALSFRDAIADGDAQRATATFDAMPPGERTLSSLYAAHPGPGVARRPRGARHGRPRRPVSLPPLLRASGDDATAPFAGHRRAHRGRRLRVADPPRRGDRHPRARRALRRRRHAASRTSSSSTFAA